MAEVEGLQEMNSLSNERFGFTLFLSLCIHGVIILGVGFGIYEQFQEASAMEVTLAQYQSETPPEEADFLAQANQSGSGSLEEAVAPSTPVEAPFHDEAINEVNPVQQEQQRQQLQENPQREVLTAREAELATEQQREEENHDQEAEQADDRQDEEEMSETLASLQAQLDLQRQAYAKRPRRYTISSASTQESRDALYLDAWRKRIEAVGNLNYPREASARSIYGNLRLLVALQPDGSVNEIRILRSSGQSILDEAAIRIVNQAAPFDPFPENMREEVDILEIIRTWQFHQGDTFSSY